MNQRTAPQQRAQSFELQRLTICNVITCDHDAPLSFAGSYSLVQGPQLCGCRLLALALGLLLFLLTLAPRQPRILRRLRKTCTAPSAPKLKRGRCTLHKIAEACTQMRAVTHQALWRCIGLRHVGGRNLRQRERRRGPLSKSSGLGCRCLLLLDGQHFDQLLLAPPLLHIHAYNY